MTAIRCCQLAPRLLDLDANATLSTAAVRDAVAEDADVIVLPELVTSGYMMESDDEVRTVAISRDDAILQSWSEAVRGTQSVVVGGFAERGDDGVIYNSAAVVDASGVLAVYRKTHLWNREKRIFQPGDQPPPVVDTAHGRLGILVCYDLEIPEVPRMLALAGADLLVAPTNWGRIELPVGVEPPQLMMARAAARANHVFVAVCDRTGDERGQQWTGGSAVLDAEGWILARPDADGVVRADIDPLLARDRDLSEVNHLFDDRRPELYTSLAAGIPARS